MDVQRMFSKFFSIFGEFRFRKVGINQIFHHLETYPKVAAAIWILLFGVACE